MTRADTLNFMALVLTEAQRRNAWGQPCAQTMGKVTIDGRQFACNAGAIHAFTAWEMVRARHGYKLTGNDTGIYNCRVIRGTRIYSSHAWALALDVNWLENPDGNKLKTDIPPAMREDLTNLRTNSGAPVFRWGGDWDRDPRTDHSYYDAMHWEVVAHPDDLASGIAGLALYPDDDMQQVLKIGDRGNGVAKVQRKLNKWNPPLALKEDGIYGPKTEAAVRLYQQAANIMQTGEVDGLTIGFLLDTGESV